MLRTITANNSISCHILFIWLFLSTPFIYTATINCYPTVIRGLSAGFLNASSLRVAWEASSPSENVTGYDVIVLKESSRVSHLTVSNGTLSVTVPSLDQCSNYTVKVAANSTAGLGNYSTFEFISRCGKDIWVPYNMKFSRHINFTNFAIFSNRETKVMRTVSVTKIR